MRLTVAAALALLCACASEKPKPAPAEGIFAPLGSIQPRADDDQRATFERGRKVAERRFAPEEGLGPTYNVVACAACHEKPVTGGGGGHYRDFLLDGSMQRDGSFIPLGKNGVQDQFSLHTPVREPTPPEVNHTATRNPIPFFGVGLLAEIDEQEILRHADPDDADADGISGRPNYDRGYVGRFGVKAQTVSIEKFIRGPLFNHLGITTDPLTDEQKAALPVPSAADLEGDAGAEAMWRKLFITVARAQVAAPDGPTRDDDGVPDPEMSTDDLYDLVSFAMLLAAPEPSKATPETERGRAHFERVGCAACHVPALAGPKGLVPAFTDLLLHDMGEELADGIVMGDATGDEFRTAPLWGVSAIGPYLHDGRADTLDEAILAHGGEAQRASDAYRALKQAERGELLAFLRSLGGDNQTSAGLLAPDAPLLPDDALGAPRATLDDEERARFLRGRALFDRDHGESMGLGPRFNGDSCRACHFDPVIGGGGPLDVNVTRQGLVDDLGHFNAPAMGTMAHRHQTEGLRPPIDPDATLFELRQTSPLFGLGLIDQIAEDAIAENADPNDDDHDGVSGRAHWVTHDRLGRFGWKADVPSLLDFARDALSTELGLTLPADDESRFGVLTDDDGVADPEVSDAELSDLLYFMRELAPPARVHADRAQEARGEALFAEVGCAACHVPELATETGDAVTLYSDLLLHDVAEAAYVGIAAGNASPRELRTPPLWGLRDSAPYMHDGAAGSIEQAIAQHAAEAESARGRFEQLAAGARGDLLAFLSSL